MRSLRVRLIISHALPLLVVVPLVGVALTAFVRAVSPMNAMVGPLWISLGVSLGVVVGLVAGVYPAARAARLDPVDALRHE